MKDEVVFYVPTACQQEGKEGTQEKDPGVALFTVPDPDHGRKDQQPDDVIHAAGETDQDQGDEQTCGVAPGDVIFQVKQVPDRYKEQQGYKAGVEQFIFKDNCSWAKEV